MRFNIELEGIIDASTQADADALAEIVAARVASLYGPSAPASLFGDVDARIATMTVAAVVEKTAISE